MCVCVFARNHPISMCSGTPTLLFCSSNAINMFNGCAFFMLIGSNDDGRQREHIRPSTLPARNFLHYLHALLPASGCIGVTLVVQRDRMIAHIDCTRKMFTQSYWLHGASKMIFYLLSLTLGGDMRKIHLGTQFPARRGVSWSAPVYLCNIE